ncbi:hypothetical protein HY009_04035, partial [Candidatus Acetothermia bacterium]|nr:hypothetical protein [Candidatus Acetothermia bacterium]
FLLHVLEEMIAFGFFLTQGRGLDFLKGKWDALRALPKLLDKRRQIQQSRSVSTEYIRTMMRRDWWSLKWARWRRLRDFAQVGEDVEVGSVLRGK